MFPGDRRLVRDSCEYQPFRLKDALTQLFLQAHVVDGSCASYDNSNGFGLSLIGLHLSAVQWSS